MTVLAKALVEPDCGFRIIAGDIVPYGSRMLYENVRDFIETIAISPVYTLCGNHDTDFFTEYFGHREYAIVSDKLLILVLDNATRKFTQETVDFCAATLRDYQRDNIMILFHIPAPNSQCGNSVKPEEWEKLRQAYLPYLSQIKYFVCGHVHSFFTDTVDGVPLIVTGGGGARIEKVNDRIDEKSVQHHIVRFRFDESDELVWGYVSLEKSECSKEIADREIKRNLEEAFSNECTAMFRYKFLAEEAERESRTELARLFRALSDSEYFHARNHFNSLGLNKPLRDHIAESISTENYEVESMYREFMEHAESGNHALAHYSFTDAFEAEKVHRNLLSKALETFDDRDCPSELKYYTCTSCGYTFHSQSPPQRCPVCGAPHDKIIQSS